MHISIISVGGGCLAVAAVLRLCRSVPHSSVGAFHHATQLAFSRQRAVQYRSKYDLVRRSGSSQRSVHVFPPAVSGGHTPHRQMSVSRSHQQTHRRVTNHAVYFQHCASTLSRWLCYSIGAWSQFHRTANATPQGTATHTTKTQRRLTTETAKTQRRLTTETAKTQRRLTTQTAKTQRTISMTLASHDHTLSNNPAFPTHQQHHSRTHVLRRFTKVVQHRHSC